jgi:hypothetical protein
MDVLPDDVLLEIFDSYVIINKSHRSRLGAKSETEAWQSLVHVCQRWRSLVFQSPRHLNLQLYCTPITPARDALDVWPILPLIVAGNISLSSTKNIIAALRQSNRVCQVFLLGSGWQLIKVLARVHVPFPELTDLLLFSYGETPPDIPDSFLGGSAPRLQYVELSGIPFPGLPNLLLSATHLVRLRLVDIPRSGYISPETMVALLSVLSSLDFLELEFKSHQSFRDRESRSLPARKNSILPALDEFYFRGVAEYLEVLVTFIDAPQLKFFYIHFFSQIDFDTPRLAQFINRTPKLRKCDAHVEFYNSYARVELLARSGILDLSISRREPDRQLSSIEQVCNSSLHPLSTAENLYIEHRYRKLVWKNDAIENILWLELLLPFTAAKNLYLSREFAPGIGVALQELVGDRITEVLPSLQNLFVEELELSGPFQENIGQFVAARQLSDHPIAVSVWDRGRM